MTLLGFYLTIYFSNKNFVLAKNQFDNSEKHRVEDKVEQRRKDSLQDITLLVQKRRDSIRHYNDSIYNNQQLTTIKRQASVAEKQLQIQVKLNKDQFELDKPIFYVDRLMIDSSISNKFPIVHIPVKNVGKRKVKMDSIYLMAYNPINQYQNGIKLNFGNEMVPDNEVFPAIEIPMDLFFNPSTCYYLKYIYYDSKVRKSENFFYYIFRDKNFHFEVKPVTGINLANMIKEIKRHEKYTGELYP